jgi:flagellar biosynthetic protein FliR
MGRLCKGHDRRNSRHALTELSKESLLESADFIAWLFARWGATALVFARVLGLAWTAPGWSTQGLGVKLRIGLVILLTGLLAPLLQQELVGSFSLQALGRFWVTEVAVGAAFGASCNLIIAAARQAGEIVGAQAGLSAASFFDPEAGGDEMTAIGHLYGWIALGSFIALDGPLILVGTLVESYQAVPFGGVILTEANIGQAFSQVGWGLSLALRAAAPAALALLFSGLALALAARTASALQIMNLTLPVRIVAGLLLVLLGLVPLISLFSKMFHNALGVGVLSS